MCGFKGVIQKSNVPDNAKAVGENGKLVSITEMSIDVLLFCIRAGSGGWRHEAVSHSVRIDVRFIFVAGLEPSDEGIKGFRVVFLNIQFNAGGIKGKHLCKGTVNGLAEWFGEIDHVLEHQFNVGKKVLFKAGEKGGIRHPGETTEVPQFPAEGKKEDEQGIGRDGKNLLEDKGREKAGKRVKAFPSEGLESIVKNRRNKLRDIEMLLKELEEGRGCHQ